MLSFNENNFPSNANQMQTTQPPTAISPPAPPELSNWSVFNNAAVMAGCGLSPGTYRIQVGKKTNEGFAENLAFQKIPDMEVPRKLYGKVTQQAKKILNTFFIRGISTSALFAGEKGSGKTILAKLISRIAAEDHNVVTIIIDQEIYGPEFNTLLQNLKQPLVVLFDEFEKIYSSKAQGEMLTLFDGVASTHKLFILTINEMRRVNVYMQNRPGRVRYLIGFYGLEEDFIREYCADCLENKAHTDDVVIVSQYFSNFSFDMLQALVEEMNIYSESAEEAMSLLNMKPEEDSSGTYDIVPMRNEKPISYGSMHPLTCERNPLNSDGMRITLYPGDSESRSPFGNTGSSTTTEPPKPDANAITSIEQYVLDVTKFLTDDTGDGVFAFGTNRADTTIEFRRRARNKTRFNYSR